jgi:hypothetical protein
MLAAGCHQFIKRQQKIFAKTAPALQAGKGLSNAGMFASLAGMTGRDSHQPSGCRT